MPTGTCQAGSACTRTASSGVSLVGKCACKGRIYVLCRARQDENDAAAAAAIGGQKPGWPGPGWFFIPAFKGKGDPGADEEKGMPFPNPKTGETGMISCEL